MPDKNRMLIIIKLSDLIKLPGQSEGQANLRKRHIFIQAFQRVKYPFDPDPDFKTIFAGWTGKKSSS
jgi:hypothetical protein